jgi:hypothetical protein
VTNETGFVYGGVSVKETMTVPIANMR